MFNQKVLQKIFFASLAVKLLICVLVPLALDEFYYFLWGDLLSLSYFDHPPMVGWMMALAQPLKQWHPGAIRWPFVLLGHATIFLWLRLFLSEAHNERSTWFLWVALLNPLWGWGGIIATPDIPLLFFWTWSLFNCHHVLQHGRWRDYLLLGLSLGLGFLSKYHIVLFIPPLLWVIFQQKAWRRVFTSKSLAAIGVGALACTPVLLWNAQHEWASFVFQWKHGMNPGFWKWTIPFEYVGGQLLIIFPTFLIFLFAGSKHWKQHWLMPFAFFPFLFFLYSSFKGRVEANWTLVGLPAVYYLSCLYTPDRFWHWIRKTVYFWSLVFVLALGIVVLKPGLKSLQTNLSKVEKFTPLATELPQPAHYFATSYQMAGFLSFQWDRVICKFPHYGRVDHFSYVANCLTFPNHFFIIFENGSLPPLEKDFPNFKIKSVKPIAENFQVVEIENTKAK